MRMKSYAVRLYVTGYVTVFVDAPDYEEAEDIAIEQAGNEDWNEFDLDFDVTESEEVDGSCDD